MSYSAYVPCDCFKKGKLYSRPPYEAFVVETEYGLELDLPRAGNQDKHNEFWRWRNGNVCPHEEMRMCYEFLSNMSGMGGFRVLCHRLGEEHFPILNQYLPKANGGYLPAEYAGQLLDELHKLENLGAREGMIELRETTNNYIVYSVYYEYDEDFAFSGVSPYCCGLGKEGLYVKKKHDVLGHKFGSKIWASRSFTQEKSDTGEFFFRDKISGEKVNVNINLLPYKETNNSFFDFKVVQTEVAIEGEYAYMIEPLLRLAAASIETGNNIYWA